MLKKGVLLLTLALLALLFDGTLSFVRGVPAYAVLIGLEVEGEPAAGVAYFPALDEMIAAATAKPELIRLICFLKDIAKNLRPPAHLRPVRIHPTAAVLLKTGTG